MVDVSIIIPVYNVKPYLRRCLATVTGQTHRNLEILLIDDGSTDGSAAVCDELAQEDERIQVVHKENGGVGRARNTGLELAQGAYVLFCDPDDLTAPTLVEENLHLALAHGADMVVFGHGTVYAQDTDISTVSQLTLPRLQGAYPRAQAASYFQEAVLFSLTIWTRLYKRSFLQENHLRFTDQSIAEDAIFNLDCLAAPFSTIVFNQKAYYFHLIRSGSAVSQYEPRLFSFECNVAKKLEQVLHTFSPVPDRLGGLVDFFYLRAFSITLGNLSEPSCPLDRKEKLAVLRRMLAVPGVKQALSAASLSDFRRRSEKVKIVLLKCRCYRLVIWLGERKKNAVIQRK